MDKNIVKFEETEIEEFKFHQYKSPILINDIDINEIIVSNEFPFDNKILNILLVTKIIKKLDLYAYSFQKWVYKRYPDETKCIYFLIKHEKKFW